MKLNMSFKKLSIINSKTFIADNFDKMIQSATLLKILPDYGIELIFIDEYSVSSRGHKIYGWAEKGKKVIISHYSGAESFSVIKSLSLKLFYTLKIK